MRCHLFRSGQEVNRYVVLGKLARGGMAEVWLARQRGPAGFQKTLVLKSIASPFNEDPAFVEMFLAEARLAALINHPNVVQIFDLEDAPGAQFIAMEYLEGRNLFQVTRAMGARAMPFDASVAVRMLAEVCAGLDFAHALKDNRGAELKIIHRDVTPENIFVSYQGHIKVLDFGIAKAAQGANTTKPGNVRGKLLYLAPEQVLGHPLDRRVDIWSVGVNLYVLLTGKFPFEGPNELEHMRSILQHAPDPPSKVRPDLPPSLDAIVMRALEKEPARRYPTAGALRLALEEFLRDQPPVSAFHVASLMELLFPASTDPIRQKLDALLSLPTEEIVRNLSGETSVVPRAGATPVRPLPSQQDANGQMPPPEMLELNTAQFAAAMDGSFKEPAVVTAPQQPAALKPLKSDPRNTTLPPTPSAEHDTAVGPPPAGLFGPGGIGDENTNPNVELVALGPQAHGAGSSPAAPNGQAESTVVAPPPARVFEPTVRVRVDLDADDITLDDHPPPASPEARDVSAEVTDPVWRVQVHTVRRQAERLLERARVQWQALDARQKKLAAGGAGGGALLLVLLLALTGRSPAATRPVDPAVAPPPAQTGERPVDPVPPPSGDQHPAEKPPATPPPDMPEPVPDDTPEEKLPEPRRGTPTGALAISSNVRANVYVDGRMVGRTPLRLGNVTIGEHRVKVVFRASEGAVSKDLTVPVMRGVLTERRVTFGKGRLNIRVSPWAEVRVDGRRFGVTPMAPVSLMEGEHELTLENKDLKARKVMRVTVEAGKDVEVKVKMGD